MAHFAPVAPIHILKSLQERGLLGDYHLFLAHHTVEDPGGFQGLVGRHIMDMTKSPHNRAMTIIMDNSIVELGGAVDDAMIYAATRTVSTIGTKVIPCLPDVMGDSVGTIDLSVKAYSRWRNMDMGDLSGQGFMLVTQGETYEAFVNLVNFFLLDPTKFPAITWVGIPRYILKQWPEVSRRRAVAYIRMLRPDIKIHLLGFSQDITDDLLCARMYGVVGIDSAVPVRYNGLLSPITTEEEIGKRGDWFENGELTPHNCRNIQNVRKWAAMREVEVYAN